MSKKLVVYYSRKGENFFPGGIKSVEKGNTEYAAEYIAKAVGADLFEVDTVKPYAANYRECCGEAVAEMKANARPDIKAFASSIEEYDTIYVCFPCWCGTMPMCMFTFLDHYDLTGKKLAPLCTNEGSGLANSVGDLQKNYPTAVVTEGLSVRGHQAQESEDMIAEWAKRVLA